MLEADRNKNDEKIDEIDREIKRIKKTIRTRRQKNREHRGLSLRVIQLRNLKTEIRNNVDALKKLISLNEEAKDIVKHKMKELERKF